MMYANSKFVKRFIVVFTVTLVVMMNGKSALAQPGTVLSHQKITTNQGGGPPLHEKDFFGWSTTSLGDLNGDGVTDLAVGGLAAFDEGKVEDCSGFRGAVWILFLKPNGTVGSYQKISFLEGGGPPVEFNDAFGNSVAAIGDLDGDGVVDLAVGAFRDDDGGTEFCNECDDIDGYMQPRRSVDSFPQY